MIIFLIFQIRKKQYSQNFTKMFQDLLLFFFIMFWVLWSFLERSGKKQNAQESLKILENLAILFPKFNKN